MVRDAPGQKLRGHATPVQTIFQLGRFGVFGLALNGLLYALYLLLTWLGFQPVVASTLAFVVGVPLSLVVHRRFTFRAAPISTARKAAFVGLYLLAYVAQIGTLWTLHEVVGVPHPVAQAVAIVAAAAVLFVVQKVAIFRI